MSKKLSIIGVLHFLLLLFMTQYCAGLEVPVLEKRVTDQAKMLNSSTTVQLEEILAALEEKEATQIAVLTINSLQGESLEAYSLRVVENWKLGRDDLDNGVLLLIAKNDRKIRIEVGYGLEGVLTDLTSGRIIRNVIGPHFKNGDFDQGVIDGVAAMIAAVRGEYKDQGGKKSSGAGQDQITGFLIFILFFLFTVGKIFGRNKILAASVGSATLPVLTSLFTGFSWPLFLTLIPAGFLVGYLSSMFLGRSFSRSPKRISRNSDIFQGGFSSGRGGFGGGGGFSGGGGGFGGGGSSGGW